MKISSIKNWMNKWSFGPKSHLSSTSGFTLIELLVAMTVFAMFIGVLASSYLFLTRAQRDTNELRKVYSESRFIMDEIIDAARGSEIAYDCYNSTNSTCEGATTDIITNSIQGSVLAMMRPDGKRVVIKSVNDCSESENACYVLKKVVQKYDENSGWIPSTDDGYYPSPTGGFQNLNLEKLSVGNAHFVLKPATPDPSISPYIQIYLSLNGNSQIRDSVGFDVQTTVSLRNY